jgi:hypothetical protein
MARLTSLNIITDARHYFVEHPVTSLGMAFAAGFVFAAWLFDDIRHSGGRRNE